MVAGGILATFHLRNWQRVFLHCIKPAPQPAKLTSGFPNYTSNASPRKKGEKRRKKEIEKEGDNNNRAFSTSRHFRFAISATPKCREPNRN